ncbi:hypothetical protein YPPY07_1008, partial [Yersinia pestis PY-07]
MQKLVNL